MAAVLFEETREAKFLVLNLLGRVLRVIDHQNQFQPGIGPHSGWVEGVEGKNVCRMVVVKQREAARVEAGNGRSGWIADDDIELEAAFGWQGRLRAGRGQKP